MATIEKNSLISFKDESGDRVLVYPITKAECVEGLAEIAEHSNKTDNPHKVTASQIPYIEGTEETPEKSVSKAIQDLENKKTLSISVVGETLCFNLS